MTAVKPTGELVRRLRMDHLLDPKSTAVRHEAADTIDSLATTHAALVAENAKLKKAIKEHNSQCEADCDNEHSIPLEDDVSAWP